MKGLLGGEGAENKRAKESRQRVEKGVLTENEMSGEMLEGGAIGWVAEEVRKE